MRWYRFLPLVLILAGLITATAIFRGPARAPASSTQPLTLDIHPWLDAGEDASATARLDQVLSRLSPQRIAWLQTTIRQEMHLPGMSFHGTGRYLLAPDQRFRLELQLQLDGSTSPQSEGAILAVSDGRDLWQASRTGPGDWDKVARLRLNPVEQDLSPTELISARALRGIEPLVRDLRAKLRWVHMERQGGKTILLGCWKPNVLSEAKAGTWPEGLPRLCRLIVEDNDWPGRIEWWGTDDGRGGKLQAVIEFSDPIINQPMDPASCRREFSFDPGSVNVRELKGDEPWDRPNVIK